MEKKYDLALESFKKCLKIDKDHFDSWVKCALILRRSDKYNDAIEIYKHIIQKHPNNPDLIVDLCDTMFENNQKDESEKILKKLIDNDPNNSNAKKFWPEYTTIHLGKRRSYFTEKKLKDQLLLI